MSEREVRRETVVDAGPAEVWEAFTDSALLAEWLADAAEIDAVPGGEVSFEFPDGERAGAVRSVDEGRSLEFSWTRPGQAESFVRFELEPCVSGTRVVVTESVPAVASAASMAAGWSAALQRFAFAVRLALV